MRQGLGLGGVGLLAIVCCAGLPLLVAAGISLVALAWGGAVVAAAVVVIAGFVLVGARRRSHADRTSAPDSRADAARKQVG
ncbi:MAG: hypothetical protein WD689_01225 [Gaiellaceae bacterium]